jgi:hypothetical protein
MTVRCPQSEMSFLTLKNGLDILHGPIKEEVPHGCSSLKDLRKQADGIPKDMRKEIRALLLCGVSRSPISQ